MTVDYVGERQQFGVPIGSFQAVKHHLADARRTLEFARPLVYRAAALARHRGRHRGPGRVDGQGAGVRRRLPGRAGAALQCHGAIGYTFEYDLHLYMKRAWALAPGVGRRRLAPRSGSPSAILGSDGGARHGRGLHRRRSPHARRAAGRRARAGPPGRPRRPHASARSSSAPASTRPRSRTSCSAASTRSAPQAGDIARTCWLVAGLPEDVPGHHRRPPVRLVAAGGALRGPGRDVRHEGRGRRRRRAEHERRSRSASAMTRRASSSASPTRSPTSPGWVARYGAQEARSSARREMIAEKWDISREDMEEFAVESHDRGPWRPEPRAASRARSSRSATARADEGPREPDWDKIRSLPPLSEGGRLTAAVRVADLRRVGRAADRQRAGPGRPRPDAAGAHPPPLGAGRRPGVDADRADPGHRVRAREGRA